ncbi:MAG TPA: DNA methyltransferase [Bryobacteraceae bacterium]|jgi:DNA modification methylase|nr:DNA methyltransferase [Bryobacteraceae bacterium]
MRHQPVLRNHSINLRNLQVRRLAVEKIKIDPRNARTHSDAQLAAVAESIREFNWTNPVLIRPDGVLIAGHARLIAAKRLGLSEVPVIDIAGLTDAQCGALAIADNQLGLRAEWDEALLRAELATLQQQCFNLDSIGFDQKEVARLLAKQAGDQELADPNAVPETSAVPVTEPGDLWILGEHRLLCGDTTLQGSLSAVLKGRTADLVFTDPADVAGYRAVAARRMKIESEDIDQEFEDYLRAACTNLIAASTGAIYICSEPSKLFMLHRAFVAAGGHWSTFVIWAKHQSMVGPGEGDYQREYEPILYGWPAGRNHYWCGNRKQGDVWQIPCSEADRDVPNRKPVELVERALQNSSRPGDTVLDPFAGLGTTLIARHRQKRRACLTEIDPKQVDIICRRWEQYSGETAILERNRQTFLEVAGQRHPAA